MQISSIHGVQKMIKKYMTSPDFILVGREKRIKCWSLFKWMYRTLPRLLIMVLRAALPLAHLFTGDWIRLSYLDAVYLAEPVIVCGHM